MGERDADKLLRRQLCRRQRWLLYAGRIGRRGEQLRLLMIVGRMQIG